MNRDLTGGTMDRFLRLIPTPLLVLGTMTVGFLLLLGPIPDPIPFIDEALLLFVFGGAVSTLLERRRLASRAGRVEPSPSPDPAVRGLKAGRVTSDLKSATRELAKAAKSLRAAGHPGPSLDALVGLPDETRSDIEELKAAEAYLSRKKHDPYLLDRELRKLESLVAAAETEGNERGVSRARQASAATQARRAEVLGRRERRDDLLLSMHRLATQSGALLEDLRAVQAERPGPPFLAEGLPDLDRRFADVLADLAQTRTAEVEVEQTLSRGSVTPVTATARRRSGLGGKETTQE